jgi:hypothetical protein
MLAFLYLLLGSGLAFAHHAAESIVDEEVYAMIDEMVADTPHAEMTLEDLGSGMTEMTIETRTPVTMENLLEDGLLTYLSMLDGDVLVEISFGDGSSVLMTITQQE